MSVTSREGKTQEMIYNLYTSYMPAIVISRVLIYKHWFHTVLVVFHFFFINYMFAGMGDSQRGVACKVTKCKQKKEQNIKRKA